jgi:hypothetical protein
MPALALAMGMGAALWASCVTSLATALTLTGALIASAGWAQPISGRTHMCRMPHSAKTVYLGCVCLFGPPYPKPQ